MNRPQVNDYKIVNGSRYITVNEYVNYHKDLEKYCDRLERALDELALQNEYNEKQTYYLKKQVDILARDLAKQLKVSISTVRGRMLFELEESEKE